ncbi:uncharacterized protein N7529_005081 [Penicillium soppii]|jgi:uncharacterized protein YdeI (YjbR/CyaY-like superfamily)|uniref:uncharacterized protein n=1 Tax=Penicillium soppii TaxID=69789 RepID=UPI0025467D1C|nr:uncharacterized protein N7529_005081 [Penicillium soppii]KAJ5872728.1 hypothetical protein N7529_005081 [Penicillium soppii]
MSTKPPPTDLPTHSFSTTKELEAFFEREHSTLPGFHLKLAKKASKIQSVTAAEAVETALCFGWIDGQANAYDKDWWLVRYTPRRAKSIWSQKNVNTVGRLLENGRLRPAGLAAVEAAKADGRWDRAYAGPATITVPDDFATALAMEPAAAAFFSTLKKSDRYSVLWRVQTASPKSRNNRIKTLVQTLAEGNWPAVPATSVSKRRDTSEEFTEIKEDTSVISKKQRRTTRLQGGRHAQDNRES